MYKFETIHRILITVDNIDFAVYSRYKNSFC